MDIGKLRALKEFMLQHNLSPMELLGLLTELERTKKRGKANGTKGKRRGKEGV